MLFKTDLIYIIPNLPHLGLLKNVIIFISTIRDGVYVQTTLMKTHRLFIIEERLRFRCHSTAIHTVNYERMNNSFTFILSRIFQKLCINLKIYVLI